MEPKINTRLLDAIKEMVQEEKKLKEYKRKVRMRGIIAKKSLTKNKSISLRVEDAKGDLTFTILQTHTDRYGLAQKLEKGKSALIEGIPKFRFIICTGLRQLDKPIETARQEKLFTTE